MIFSLLLFLGCGNEKIAELETKIDSMNTRITALEERAQNEQKKQEEVEQKKKQEEEEKKKKQDAKAKCSSIKSKIKKLRRSWKKCVSYETEYAWEDGGDKRYVAKTCGKKAKPLYKEGKKLGCSLKGILVGKFFDGSGETTIDMYYYAK